VQLLGENAPKGYKHRVEKLPPASGAFVVYLGVDESAIPLGVRLTCNFSMMPMARLERITLYLSRLVIQGMGAPQQEKRQLLLLHLLTQDLGGKVIIMQH
jgi:hypothetical protein